MQLPQLTPPPNKRVQNEYQTLFLGYNARKRAGGQEFTSMRNMSSDEYPMLAPRKKRRLIRTTDGGATLLGGDTLSWVDGGKLFYGGEAVADGISADAQLVRMGAYLIAWPDKVIYNTATKELSWMNHTWSGTQVHARPCMLSGQELTYTAGEEAPDSPHDGQYWLDTSINGLYQYLGGTWQGLDTVYTRLEADGIGSGFMEYDVVQISGMDYENFNLDAATVYAVADDYIVIATGETVDLDISGSIMIKREAPELDYIVESGNRLWGCSNKTHEIRGSKLGDPTNWNSYLGISTDSYAATVGSVGEFTGVSAYHGYVHFWKEERVHRLYGTQPANFQLIETQMRGVKAGCWRSLCVINELLCYMSRDGMMRYDGSSPISMQEPLGDHDMDEVVCGAHQNKLYLSCLMDGAPVLMAMDLQRGTWHIEDETRAVAFASTGEGDFFLNSDGEIWSIDGAGSALEDGTAADEDDFDWWAVSGDMLEDSLMVKTLRQISLRLEMERGTRVMIDLMYNSDGKWLRTMDYSTENKKTVTLPMQARSCDHIRIKYSGRGRAIVQRLCRTYNLKDGKACLTYRQ